MVLPTVSRSRTSTMDISLLGWQPLRPRGCGCVSVDIGARIARYNPRYHARAVLACRPRRSRSAAGADWNLLLDAAHAECSSTATARPRKFAAPRASPRNHNQEESADG